MKQALGECSSLAALKGNEEFHSADHKAVSREVRSELKVRKKAKDDSS
jgi:hypothetical protein